MVRELVLRGYQVRACIRDGASWRGQDCVQYLRRLPRVRVFDSCDLFDPGTYDAAFRGCVAVFHTAAVLGNSADGQSQPKGSGDVATDIYKGGIEGTKNIVNAINRSDSVERLIYTSSMAAVSGAKGATLPAGYMWSETDWASDGVPEEVWHSPRNAYARSKVDSEKLINEAAEDSDGEWDAITMNPAMICGPVLFKAQVGQWIKQLGRMAAGMEPNWPTPYDMYYNIIDVRDLVKAQRLAAESDVDHANTHGGPRYLMHGTGGRSSLRLGTEVANIIRNYFPHTRIGTPQTVTAEGKPIQLAAPKLINDCHKAKNVLGATIRPVEETIRDVIESSLELGVVESTFYSTTFGGI